jgi:hypothetical protein
MPLYRGALVDSIWAALTCWRQFIDFWWTRAFFGGSHVENGPSWRCHDRSSLLSLYYLSTDAQMMRIFNSVKCTCGFVLSIGHRWAGFHLRSFATKKPITGTWNLVENIVVPHRAIAFLYHCCTMFDTRCLSVPASYAIRSARWQVGFRYAIRSARWHVVTQAPPRHLANYH